MQVKRMAAALAKEMGLGGLGIHYKIGSMIEVPRAAIVSLFILRRLSSACCVVDADACDAG